MRITNKYIRNSSFRCKAWKRIRNRSHPFETTMPYRFLGSPHWTFDEQVKSHFEWIEQQSRAIENGTHKHWNHASADFRRQINKERKAKERSVMGRVRKGDYEAEFPKFKRDADWLYF